MIKIDISVGDVVMGGKFKNKCITVKTIGTDEYGTPTINGKKLLNVRIPKLYKKEGTIKLKDLVK